MGLNHTTLFRMVNEGVVPSIATVKKWAAGIGEPESKWLALAYSDQEPPQNTQDGSVNGNGEPRLTFTQPEPPELVRTMIERATTREDKIAVAFNYLASLPDVRLGADGVQSPDARLQVIRTYERYTNVRLLPPEVV